MRAILISVAILLLSSPMLAQQRRQPPVVQRTFVPDEPIPCVAFNRMAARLDAVYKIEPISKSDYDAAMKNYMRGGPEEGVDYFMPEKDKYERVSLQPDKLAEFIRWYAVDGGRGQMLTADAQCSTELGERAEKYSGIYNLRQLQDAMTIAQAEGLLADIALQAQKMVTKALLESEDAHRKDVDRYNKLVENVNTYNKAVNDLVATVNSAMSGPKSTNFAPKLTFNVERLQPITCTGSSFAFTNFMANMRAMANSTPTMQCE